MCDLNGIPLFAQLLKAEEELSEMREMTQTKYVSKRRKETLQMELAQKEVLCLLIHCAQRPVLIKLCLVISI